MGKLTRHGLWPGERGFTVIEVMTTIIIMAILAGIAFPAWFWLVESRRVDSAANQLVADMRLANASATNQLTDWRIVYRTDGAKVDNCPVGQSADYCLVKNIPAGSERTPRFLPEGTRISDTTVSLDTDTGLLEPSVANTTRTIKFNSDGSAQAMGGLVVGATSPTVTVSSDDGNPNHVISLNSATSRVRID